MSLTITVPFAGKDYSLERVLGSLKKLNLPDWPVRWVFLDNSGDPVIYQKLQQFLVDQGEADKEHGAILTKLMVEPKGTFSSVCDVFNYLRPHVVGNWLSIEDDVCEFPPDTISRFYREIYSRWDLGIVAAHMEARRGWPGPMVWRVEDFEEKGLGLRPCPPRQEQLTLVDAVHTGCTMIRPSVYLDYEFRHTGDAHMIIGHDIHMCLDAREKGLSTGILWNLRAAHMGDDGSLYPAQLPSMIASQLEMRSAHPMVSVITPTSSRPRLLARLIKDLQGQTYNRFEHLICNDGPSRFVGSMVEREGDLRQRYFELGFRHGFSGAPQRNLLLQKAGGDLVVFLDDDVEIEKDYLATMVSLWREGNLVGFCQVEIEDPEDGTKKIIPENKEMVNQIGHVDSMCGFVDSCLAKAFFWDLFDEHDARYFMQVLYFTRGACGFVPKVVGRNRRRFGVGDSQKPKKSAQELVLELSRSYKGPTPEAEILILKDPQAVLLYVMNALDGKRWEKGEESLLRNPRVALFYIQNVLLGKRWEAAEEVFAKDVRLAIAYSETTKVRWKDTSHSEVEDKIKKDPLAAVDYAGIWGRPWEEAEVSIKTNPVAWQRYLGMVNTAAAGSK